MDNSPSPNAWSPLMNDRQGRIGGQGRWNDFQAPDLGIRLRSKYLISLRVFEILCRFPSDFFYFKKVSPFPTRFFSKGKNVTL